MIFKEEEMNKVKPYMLYLLNMFLCAMLLTYVVWPNFYIGLTMLQYVIFYGVLLLTIVLELIFSLSKVKEERWKYNLPTLILICYWSILFFGNFI